MKHSNKKSLWGTLAIGGLFLLTKMKWVLALLKLAKLQTLISMMIYLGTYAFFYGWTFAIALVYLLFVHEMGHLYAAKKIKLPTTPAIFIPFMGAAIGMKERPKNAKDEGFLAYMGPVFGLLSFLPAIPLYLWTEEPFWALVIVFGALLNLFNLIPLSPLDGGRIVAGISTKLWGIGLVMIFAYAIWSMSILAFLILFMGIFQLVSTYKEQKNVREQLEEVKGYDEALLTLKNIGENSSYEHLMLFAHSLKATLNRDELVNTLALLAETEDEAERETNKRQFLEAVEKEVVLFRNEVNQTATYYKTDAKTKWQLFAIYIGLVAVLGASLYFSYEILPPL